MHYGISSTYNYGYMQGCPSEVKKQINKNKTERAPHADFTKVFYKSHCHFLLVFTERKKLYTFYDRALAEMVLTLKEGFYFKAVCSSALLLPSCPAYNTDMANVIGTAQTGTLIPCGWARDTPSPPLISPLHASFPCAVASLNLTTHVVFRMKRPSTRLVI